MEETYKVIITYEDVRKEVINRQKTFGTNKSADKFTNKIFAGIKYNEMIYIINHWPKCNKCNEYEDLIIEYTDEAEIPITLLYVIANI